MIKKRKTTKNHNEETDACYLRNNVINVKSGTEVNSVMSSLVITPLGTS